jgi:hypothetical protein
MFSANGRTSSPVTSSRPRRRMMIKSAHDQMRLIPAVYRWTARGEVVMEKRMGNSIAAAL